MARFGPKPGPNSCGNVKSQTNTTSEGVKSCTRTRKTISSTCFDINPRTGKLYCYCVVCKPKAEKAEKLWLATDSGKASKKATNQSDSVKLIKKAYKERPENKAREKKARATPEHLQKCRVASKTPEAKARRSDTYHKNRLREQLLQKVRRIILGGSSPSAMSVIGFDNEDEVRNLFADAGRYAVDWEIEHIIPRSAYDHDNPADVYNCWSPDNMCALHPHLNAEKAEALLRSEIVKVPSRRWPVSWNGRIPVSAV